MWACFSRKEPIFIIVSQSPTPSWRLNLSPRQLFQETCPYCQLVDAVDGDIGISTITWIGPTGKTADDDIGISTITWAKSESSKEEQQRKSWEKTANPKTSWVIIFMYASIEWQWMLLVVLLVVFCFRMVC